MLEKRHFRRLDFSIPCHFVWNHTQYEGRVVNLSFTGGCVRGVPVIPPQGSRVEIKMYLEAGTISLSGTVVHHRCAPAELPSEDAFFGVEFQDPAPERSRKLIPLLKIDLVSQDTPEN